MSGIDVGESAVVGHSRVAPTIAPPVPLHRMVAEAEAQPGRRRPSRRRPLAPVAGGVLLAFSGLLLLLAFYETFPSAWAEHRDQARLQASLGKVLAFAAGGRAQESSSTFFANGGGHEPAPRSEAVARLEIPAINARYAVVSGVSAAHLASGPALYRGSAEPGGRGNVAIAGHRTLAGGPFYHLGRLHRGNSIVITTAKGRFTYGVIDRLIVGPSETSALSDFGDSRLTLATGDPPFTARHPLVVEAALVASAPNPGAAPPAARSPGHDPLVPSVPGDAGAWTPFVVALLLAAAGGVAAWCAPATIRPVVVVLAVPVLGAVLLYGLQMGTRLLPATL